MTSVIDKYDLTTCRSCNGTGWHVGGASGNVIERCLTCEGKGERQRADVEADKADDDDGRAA